MHSTMQKRLHIAHRSHSIPVSCSFSNIVFLNLGQYPQNMLDTAGLEPVMWVAIPALCIAGGMAALSIVYRWRLANARKAEASAARAFIYHHHRATLQSQDAGVNSIVSHTARLAKEMNTLTQRHSLLITQTTQIAANQLTAMVKTSSDQWEQQDNANLHELSARFSAASETIAGHFENKHIALSVAAKFSHSRAAQLQTELGPVFSQMPGNAVIQEIADHSRQCGQQLSSHLHIPHHYQVQWQHSEEETHAAQNAACHAFAQGIKTTNAQWASHTVRNGQVPTNTPAIHALLHQYEAAVANVHRVPFQPDAALNRFASLWRQAGLNAPTAAGNVDREDTAYLPNTFGLGASVSLNTVTCTAMVPLALAVMTPVSKGLALQVSWDTFTYVKQEAIEHAIREITEHIATWLAEELGINITAEIVEGLLSFATGVILIFKLGRYGYKAYKIFVEKEPLQKIRAKIRAFVQQKGTTTSNTLAAYLLKQRQETIQNLSQYITTWKNEQESEQGGIREAATRCSQQWCEQELKNIHALKRHATRELEQWKNEAESRVHAWQWGWLRFFMPKPVEN